MSDKTNQETFSSVEYDQRKLLASQAASQISNLAKKQDRLKTTTIKKNSFDNRLGKWI